MDFLLFPQKHWTFWYNYGMDKNKGSTFRSWLVIALVAFTFFMLYRLNPRTPEIKNLTLVDFYRLLDSGKIVEPVTRLLDHEEHSTILTGKAETDETDDKGKPIVFTYRVELVPGENESLMADLFSRQIAVQIEPRHSFISPFVAQILVFLLLIGLFYWLTARRMGGDNGLFGITKSRARVLNGKEDKKKVTFADVAGVDEAKEEVQEIVEFLKKPDDFRRLGGRIPKGVLLVGPPGTGKTLLAKAIAGEAEVPFFAVSGSDFEEMFVGVGANRMRDMFSEAKKQAPCIVFIDEIDSIGMKRGATSSFTGSHAHEQTLNTMLVEMDGFDANEGVIVIAATNRPDTLDAALLRPGRFDRQVNIDLPTLKGRREILDLHGKKIKFAPDADLDRVARGTPGFSGADLANLLNEAALMSVRKKLDGVDSQTLDEARDKVLWGRERKSAGYSEHDREITAWHESGHALLQALLPGTDPLHKVTIIPRGRALGATMSLPEHDVLNRTRTHFLSELVVLCGGRIAEQIFTGEMSTGAAQDIAQATDIARKMICRYGMSARFGFQSFIGPNPYAQAENPPAFSEETARAIDQEVSHLIEDAYQRAEKLIRENHDTLERLAHALLERETMDGRDVEALIRGEELPPIVSAAKESPASEGEKQASEATQDAVAKSEVPPSETSESETSGV